MIRIATKQDFESLCTLWQQGFNENKQQAQFVFETFASYSNIHVFEKDEKIVSMLIAVDVTIDDKKGVYYYGLTTLGEYRKQGIMKQLICYADDFYTQKGKSFAVLIPQNEDLFSYYQANGFKTEFYLRKFNRNVDNNVLVQAEFDTITANSLSELRKKFITEQRVALNKKSELATVQDFYSAGMFTVETKYGYGIFEKRQDVMFFHELFATDSYMAEKILQAARVKTKCEIAQGYVAYGTDVFLGEGEKQDFGMIKFFDKEFKLTLPYMNMMLN